MRIPYILTPTPDGYEAEAYTRPAFIASLNILVEGNSKADAIHKFISEVKKFRGSSKDWPEPDDWMPGDLWLEILEG